MRLIKEIFVCFVFLFNCAYAASPSYVVQNLRGKAFFMMDGKPKQLKNGMRIGSPLELFTEVGSEVTLSDYHDHLYHLSGSTHALFHQKNLQLNEGYLWVQVLQGGPTAPTFRVSTPNGMVDYNEGEAIVSYDSSAGKTQILSLYGTFKFMNLVQDFMNTEVKEGQFSFIDLDLNNGQPRKPTPIGYGSFQKVTRLFNDTQPLHHNLFPQKQKTASPSKAMTRATASVNVSAFESALQGIKEEESSPKKPMVVKANTIPVLKLPQSKAIVDSSELMKLYEKKMSQPVVREKVLQKRVPSSKNYQKYDKKTDVMIRVYGKGAYSLPKSLKPKAAPSHNRFPASQKEPEKERSSLSQFENSLQRNYQDQKRHPEEVNHLIDELESVSIDYQQHY